MKFGFQLKPYDLFASVIFTLAELGLLLGFGIPNVPAALLVIFLPGYLLVAILFPGNGGINWIERLALSFALSIGSVPLLGFAVNFAPMGLRSSSVILTLAIFCLALALVAFFRRVQLPPSRRLGLVLEIPVTLWKDARPLDKALNGAVIFSVILVAATFAVALLTVHPNERFTEFHILGPSGRASGYPSRLNVSQAAEIILGAENHEGRVMSYTVRVDLVGVQILYNATARANDTVEVNSTSLSWFNVTLADGQNWTRPYTFSISSGGLWKVRFLLFRDGGVSAAYRELHLYVTVS